MTCSHHQLPVFFPNLFQNHAVFNDNTGLFTVEFPRKFNVMQYNIQKAQIARYQVPRVPKKAQFTHERVEYNVFLFDEPLKGNKSLKISKISLMFPFDKL
jgi:hypothetical protein